MSQQTSTWISKAGVRLDYLPEDTMKSLLIPVSDQTAPTVHTQVVIPEKIQMTRQNPEGALLVESVEHPNNEAPFKPHNSASCVDNQSRPQPGRKPVPFLKRRQGMAAWCSKIRRQGILIRDPAEELRRKPTRRTDSVNLFNQSSTHPTKQSRPAPSSNAPLFTEATNPLEQPDPQTNRHSFATHCLTNKTRCESDAQVSDSDAFCAINPAQTEGTVQTLPTDSRLNCSSDVGDLAEFEFLEEIAENSSFSSLTNSFVSKLGNSALRDRLRRAEERLERLTIADDGHENAVIRNSSAEPRVLCGDSSEYVSGQNMIDCTDASTEKSHVTIGRTPSLNCSTDGILANETRGKCKKVARFHLASVPASHPKAGPSPVLTMHETALPPQFPTSQIAMRNTRDTMHHDSVEFDDIQPWSLTSQRTSPLAPRNGPTGTECTAMPTRSASEERDSDVCFDFGSETVHQQQPDRPPSRLSIIRSGPSGVEHHSPKRSISRPSSAGSQCGPKQSVGCAKSTNSYESELITLADEFVDKVKREPNSALGRSNSESHALLRQWISRLEQEVRRFKSENANLVRMRTEREEGMKRLETETKRFEEMKIRERKLFNEYKENEMRKLKKERRVLDDYQRALKSMPNKKDREEIDRLREELTETRSDLGRREVRWHSAISRLRTRIEELESERDELKGRIQRLEADRITLQAQLTEARSAPSRSGQIRRASSAAASRQTLNSVSQSLALKTTKRTPECPGSMQAADDGRRSQQNRQFLSSCRLSSRASSRSGGLESLVDIHARRTTQLVSSGSGSGERRSPDRNSVNDARVTHRSTTPIEGARESVNSGGYFTGDDECQSANSEHAAPERIPIEVNAEQQQSSQTETNHVTEDPPKTLEPDTKQADPSVACLPLPGTAASGSVILSRELADGSLEKTYSNGAVVMNYMNGSVKEIFPDKKTIVVSLFNGDIKRTLPDGRVIYHYAADGTVQVTYPDGTEEVNYSDGRQEIVYPKPIVVTTDCAISPGSARPPSGELVSRRLPNGDREIRLPNGQREIHSISGIKCRIYPDGTTKTVFPDGRHETRYSSGRLRIKDAQGNLVLDTRLPVAGPTSQQYHPSLLPSNTLS